MMELFGDDDGGDDELRTSVYPSILAPIAAKLRQRAFQTICKLDTLRESRRGPWRPEVQRFVVNGPYAAQCGPRVSQRSPRAFVLEPTWSGMESNRLLKIYVRSSNTGARGLEN